MYFMIAPGTEVHMKEINGIKLVKILDGVYGALQSVGPEGACVAVCSKLLEEYFREMKSDFNARKYWDARLSATGVHLGSVGLAGVGGGFNRWMYRVKKAVFWRMIGKEARRTFKAHPDANTRVLDVGCGSGFYFDLWKRVAFQHWIVEGLDFSFESVKALQAWYPQHKFHQLDISSDLLKFQVQQNYHIISAMDVLFHIVDDDKYMKALENINGLLRDNGVFVFTENFLPGKARIAHKHIVHRTKEEIEAALDLAGFKIVARRPMLYFMNYPIRSESPAMHRLWSGVEKFASASEANSWWAGMGLYFADRVMTKFCREGPTVQMAICRKKEFAG